MECQNIVNALKEFINRPKESEEWGAEFTRLQLLDTNRDTATLVEPIPPSTRWPAMPLLDESRVVLRNLDRSTYRVPSNGFYHASHLWVGKCQPLILAQAPTKATSDAFCHMAVQLECSVIVNLIPPHRIAADDVGVGDHKSDNRCFQYWPPEPDSPPVVGAHYVVSRRPEPPANVAQALQDWRVRSNCVPPQVTIVTLDIALATADAASRRPLQTVVLLHYTNWIDHQPLEAEYSNFIRTALLARHLFRTVGFEAERELPQQEAIKRYDALAQLDNLNDKIVVEGKTLAAPMLIHCSAGLGRSGVFAFVLDALDALPSKGVFDVYTGVKKLRDSRPFAVNKDSQYGACHKLTKALAEMFLNKLTSVNDNDKCDAQPT